MENHAMNVCKKYIYNVVLLSKTKVSVQNKQHYNGVCPPMLENEQHSNGVWSPKFAAEQHYNGFCLPMPEND